MCPVCLATAALIAGGLTSTAGLAAIAIVKLGPKKIATNVRTKSNSKEYPNG